MVDGGFSPSQVVGDERIRGEFVGEGESKSERQTRSGALPGPFAVGNYATPQDVKTSLLNQSRTGAKVGYEPRLAENGWCVKMVRRAIFAAALGNNNWECWE